MRNGSWLKVFYDLFDNVAIMPIVPVIVDGSTLPVLFRTREVAEMLQVPSKTVTTWIRDGRLAAKPFGNTYLISAAAIEAFIRKRTERAAQRVKVKVAPIVAAAPPIVERPVVVVEPAVTRPVAMKGELEELVRDVCNGIDTGLIVEKDGQPWTPTRLSDAVACRAHHIYTSSRPPSAGAVADTLKRWRKVGFAEVSDSPLAFVRFTPEAKTLGLTALKQRYRATA